MIAHHRRAAASAVHTTMLNFSQEVSLLTRIALKNISKPVLLYLLVPEYGFHTYCNH